MADSLGVAREALTALTHLVILCPANATALLGLQAACNSLFGVCLASCGDFATQVANAWPAMRMTLLIA
jgi:hypothetical protein